MLIESWVTQDIKTAVKVRYLDGNVFSQDNLGNRVGVILYDGDSEAALSGTISASVIRADGATVAVTGASSGNRAWVDLPQSCYAVPGLISIVIKSTASSVTTTLAAVVATVYQSSTDTTVDPGTIIPSIADLIAQIQAAVASIPADYSALWTSLAPAYSDSATYEENQYCTYNGNLYRCVNAITTPETFDSGNWAVAYVGNGIRMLRDAAIADTYPVTYTDIQWVQGAIAINNGKNSDSTTRIRTGFIPQNPVVISPNSGYKLALYAYERENINSYVGVLKQENKIVATGSQSYLWHTSDILVPEINRKGYVLRIAVGHTDDSAIDPSEASAAVSFRTTATAQKDSFSQYQGIIDGTATSLATFLSYGYYTLSDVTAEDIPEGFAGRGIMVVYPYAGLSGNARYQQIITSTGKTWTRYILGSSAGDWKCAGEYNSPVNKWYVFGDSISAGYFSVTDEEAAEKGYTISYRPEGLEGVGAVWDRTLSHTYWGYANEWLLHRTLVRKAYPGQGYFRIASNDKNGIMEVQQADVSDAGLITVAWGFNDWHYNRPRGTHDLIDPAVPYPTEGYDTTQITTINQAIWFCLGELIRKAPLAKIVVQTPMNGWLYGGDFSTWWGLGYRMSNSGTLAEIHDDVKYWADYYGLQVLDMTYNNSMVNRRNIQSAMIDGSHPTDETHQQLGRYVAVMLGYC